MHGILTSISAKNIAVLILRVSIELADHSIFRMHTKKKYFFVMLMPSYGIIVE